MKAGEQNQTCYGLLQPLDSTCIGLTGSRVRSFTLGTGLEAGNDFPVDQNSSYFQGMIFNINLTHIKILKLTREKFITRRILVSVLIYVSFGAPGLRI